MQDAHENQPTPRHCRVSTKSTKNRWRACRWAFFDLIVLGLAPVWAQATVLPIAASAVVSDAIPAAEAPLLTNERHPLPGTLTGGVPAEADLPTLFQRLAGAGARTFVDLRSDAEVKPGTDAAALAAGVDYQRVPIGGEADLDLGSARALGTLLDDWSRYPVVVACGSGNRAGALLAMRGFWLDGMPAEAALALGHAAGLTKLEPSVRQLLGLPPMPPMPLAAPAPTELAPGPAKPN